MTQNDLPPATVSGLSDAVERLRSVPGVGMVFLDKSDIVRHPLVQAIVNAYEGTEPGPGVRRPRTPGRSGPERPAPAGPTASE